MEKYNKKLLDKIHFPSDLRKLPKKEPRSLLKNIAVLVFQKSMK